MAIKLHIKSCKSLRIYILGASAEEINGFLGMKIYFSILQLQFSLCLTYLTCIIVKIHQFTCSSVPKGRFIWALWLHSDFPITMKLDKVKRSAKCLSKLKYREYIIGAYPCIIIGVPLKVFYDNAFYQSLNFLFVALLGTETDTNHLKK